MAKHVALSIEQPDRRLTKLKDVVDVNKGEKPKFNSRLDARKGAFNNGSLLLQEIDQIPEQISIRWKESKSKSRKTIWLKHTG